MGILPFLGLLTALASVNASVCPAQKPVDGFPASGHSPFGDIIAAHGADSYGNFPSGNAGGQGSSGGQGDGAGGQGGNGGGQGNAPKSPAQSPDSSLSTSQDARNNPNATNSAEHRGNWLPGFDINTDYSVKWPETGNTVKATFVITNTTYAPDGGKPQEMFLINGQYPGPLLEGNWGDHFEVTVINQLQNNGTGVHWHGFRQFNNNANDGVGGVTECPIPPGGQKVYRFQATGYGSTWYHSHFSIQYGQGIFGPIVVHGPAAANYDIDVGSVVLNELYNRTSFEIEWDASHRGPPTASNYLVNGKNIKPDLSAGTRAEFKFTPGKKHLLRFVNAAVDSHFKVQLDGHKLLVIANDNVPITPYYTTELSIGIGERYDVVVVADQTVSAYYLRTIPAVGCSFNGNNGLGQANAVVVYDGSSMTVPTSTKAAAIIVPTCDDEPLASLIPIVPASVDSTGFAAQFAPLAVNVTRATLKNNEQVFLWYINGISQDIDWSRPTISEIANNANIANAGTNLPSLLPKEWSALALPGKGQWTFWVIQNQFFVPHPMHLHGHDFAVLGQGAGRFSPDKDLGSLNFFNPTRRDSVMLSGGGWTVIAFQVDNPGAWLMHCHIAYHVSSGLSLEFVELADQIPNTYGSYVSGGDFTNQCSAWSTYAQTPAYPKSDSGLRRRSGWGPNEYHREARNMDAMKAGMLREQFVKRAMV